MGYIDSLIALFVFNRYYYTRPGRGIGGDMSKKLKLDPKMENMLPKERPWISTLLFPSTFRHRWSRIKFLIIAILFIASAIAMPHVIDGHILFLPRAFAESLLISLNIVGVVIFYALYRRDVRIVLDEKKRSEVRLNSSYEYIGKANRLLAIFQKFMDLPIKEYDEKNQKNTLNLLFKELAVGIATAESAILRLVSTQNGRTISEMVYPQRGHSQEVRLSNRMILKMQSGFLIQEESLIIVNHSFPGICCAAVFQPINSAIDVHALETLANQVFLVYLLFQSFDVA